MQNTISTENPHCIRPTYYYQGLTENAGRENDGPSKLQGMKLQDVKMTDQFAGHEIAGNFTR